MKTKWTTAQYLTHLINGANDAGYVFVDARDLVKFHARSKNQWERQQCQRIYDRLSEHKTMGTVFVHDLFNDEVPKG